MNKNIVIGLGVVVVGVLLVLIFLTLKQNTQTTPEPVGNPYPVASTTTPINTTDVTGDTLTVVTANKSALRMRNFLKDAETVKDPVNAGYYVLGAQMTAAPQDTFEVFYIANTNYFGIDLLQEPLAESRREAEQYLKKRLGISEQEMCLLQYMLSVSNAVSPAHAGESLGFSFCSGSVSL